MHVKELLSLKDKICMVTGGAGRYGRCIVEGLAEADGTIISASRNLERNKTMAEEMQQAGLNVHAMQVDQSDHDSVVALRQKIAEQFGRLDVFVNNAVVRTMRGYQDDLKNFAESMRINATGMWDINREMVSLMPTVEGGSIIHISSMVGMFGPDLSNYEGSKTLGNPSPDYAFHNGGLISLAHYQAHVLADKNIRANCICPGGIESPDIQDEAFLKNYTAKVLTGKRMADTDDIKGLVVFLASKASAYITGQSILMDGGMHC